jgi:hypothetical protein
VIQQEKPAKTPLRHLTLQKLLYTSEAICYGRGEIGHLENLGIVGWIILETDLQRRKMKRHRLDLCWLGVERSGVLLGM